MAGSKGTFLKQPARRAMDGVASRVAGDLEPRFGDVLQRLDRLEAAVGRATSPSALFPGFHELLHALRTAELTEMPKGAEVVLSAGCSGRWYFDWVEQAYGPVRRHIGIERFEERPVDLPAGVEWIATSVADLSPVPDASVDLVFSGQNIEHLFGDDLVDFLCESARVVRPGGHLVLDSPHREIARLLVWSMNQHTIELTPREAAELVELAGFSVSSLRGIWLAREPGGGPLYPLDPMGNDFSATEIVRRIQLASRHPDDSFVWWLEAVRREGPPDREGLRRRHAEIFSAAWPERANRLTSPIGAVSEEEGHRVARVSPGQAGYLMIGPYMPLAAAHYTVTFRLRATSPVADAAAVAAVEVVADGREPVIAERLVTGRELPLDEWVAITVPFDVAELRWTGQFRVRAVGVAGLDTRLEVDLDDRGSPVWPSPLAGPRANAGAQGVRG
ncbi:MAG: methyltransferase domain-containing protein [Candidatus Dormibacteria bacterium]